MRLGEAYFSRPSPRPASQERSDYLAGSKISNCAGRFVFPLDYHGSITNPPAGDKITELDPYRITSTQLAELPADISCWTCVHRIEIRLSIIVLHGRDWPAGNCMSKARFGRKPTDGYCSQRLENGNHLVTDDRPEAHPRASQQYALTGRRRAP